MPTADSHPEQPGIVGLQDRGFVGLGECPLSDCCIETLHQGGPSLGATLLAIGVRLLAYLLQSCCHLGFGDVEFLGQSGSQCSLMLGTIGIGRWGSLGGVAPLRAELVVNLLQGCADNVFIETECLGDDLCSLAPATVAGAWATRVGAGTR